MLAHTFQAGRIMFMEPIKDRSVLDKLQILSLGAIPLHFKLLTTSQLRGVVSAKPAAAASNGPTDGKSDSKTGGTAPAVAVGSKDTNVMSSPPAVGGGGDGQWNERWQCILEKLWAISPPGVADGKSVSEAALRAYQSKHERELQPLMQSFVRDFVSKAERIVTLIWDDYMAATSGQSVTRKPLIPLDTYEPGWRAAGAFPLTAAGGGVSSGVHVSDGVAYRLITDPVAARKMAARAIIHTNALFNARVPRLHAPYMALFTRHGISVLVSTVIPGATLPSNQIYGLNTAGTGWVAPDHAFQSLLVPVAKHLNLRPHIAVVPTSAGAAAATDSKSGSGSGSVSSALCFLNADCQGFRYVASLRMRPHRSGFCF